MNTSRLKLQINSALTSSLSKKYLSLNQLFSLPYFLTFFLLLFLTLFNHKGSGNRYIYYPASDNTNKGEKYCKEMFVNRTGEGSMLLVHKNWKTAKVTKIICKTNFKTSNCKNLPLNRFSPLGCQFLVFWNYWIFYFHAEILLIFWKHSQNP